MKYLFILFLCFNSFSQTITGEYEFKYRENRTLYGWDKVDIAGKVIFYEDKKTNTVTITTLQKTELLYVKSRQIFIRIGSFLYTLVDNDYKECSLRIEVINTLDTLELYYYSDRIEEKYYRLILKKCK
jgi:hypothetical protein